MTVHRTQALRVPPAELERMKQALSHRYGSELWDPEGEALLVVRVPRDEPDMVNDLEGAVDYLAPGDVAQAKATLFVGHRRSHVVSTPALQGLMESRTALDRAQADAMRRDLKPGEHRVFQAPGDPRRLHRLALRLPCARVADATEAHLAPFADRLGPLLGTPPVSLARAVHLVAERDDVRLDADLFFQDLEERWREGRQRHDLAQALAAKQAAAAAGAASQAQQPPPAAGAPDLPPPRATVAPLRRHDAPHGGWDAGDGPAIGLGPPIAFPAPVGGGMGEVFEVGGSPQPAAIPPAALPPRTSLASPPGPSGAPGDATAQREAEAALAALDARLKALGYATRPRPGRHGIDLAAERGGGFPDRVIAFAPPALDVATAERVLAVARTVNADQALIVCPQAEPEARRRLIATKAKWVTAAEVPLLSL